SIRDQHRKNREEIREMLKELGTPTIIYPSQSPLFPVIYRLEIQFDDEFKAQYDKSLEFSPIVWDSKKPRHPNQYPELDTYQLFRDEGIRVNVQYQLHAYLQKQYKEREDDAKRRLINIWVLFFTFVALLWMVIIQRREDARAAQRMQVEQQIQESKQKHLEE